MGKGGGGKASGWDLEMLPEKAGVTGRGKMTRQLKVFAIKPDELSLILRPHVVEGRTNPAGCSLVSTCVVTHKYAHAKSNVRFFKKENSCQPVEMGTGRAILIQISYSVRLPNQSWFHTDLGHSQMRQQNGEAQRMRPQRINPEFWCLCRFSQPCGRRCSIGIPG